MSTPAPTNSVTRIREPVRHPFGLPLGSIRGMFAILICAFFWLTLLWPGEHPLRSLLGHYFLLALVVMAFATAPRLGGGREQETSPFLPWLLRVIFVGGSIAVVAYAAFKDLNQLQARLTPDPEEVKEWWIPFLGTMVGGFSFGLVLRFLLGEESYTFRTARAWLSVVGLTMLAIELVMFIGFASAETKPVDFLYFLRAWQCVEMVIVAAYFGTRA